MASPRVLAIFLAGGEGKRLMPLTADRAKTMPFYAEVLGLRLIAEEDFGVVFDLGGGATLRLTDMKDHAPSPHTVLGWEVPDIRAAI